MELKEAIELTSDLLKYGLSYDNPKYSLAIQTLIDHAKKSIEPLVGDALVGRKVRVLENANNNFIIGSHAIITEFDKRDTFLPFYAQNKINGDWLKRSEFELIDSE